MQAGDLVRTKVGNEKKYHYGTLIRVVSPRFICVMMHQGYYKGQYVYLRGHEFERCEVLG